MFKFGKVTSIDNNDRTAKVDFDGEFISDDLVVLKTGGAEWMPKIDDFVLCVLINDDGEGFVLGGF